MPLKKGASKKAFEYNVRELISSGKPRKQALAIAFRIQREARAKRRRKARRAKRR